MGDRRNRARHRVHQPGPRFDTGLDRRIDPRGDRVPPDPGKTKAVSRGPALAAYPHLVPRRRRARA